MSDINISSASAVPADLPIELDRASIVRHDRLQRESLALKGRLDAMLEREKAISLEVSASKGRIALKPEVESILEELQKCAHERSVGAFERMLTGITDDVLPDYQGRRKVRLDLTTERNMPALDIYIDHMGKREEITSGAVANVISTGLRFISLARSGARRLLVLDEADCWIDGVAVQNYFNVVNQLSRDAGIQTVVITHHDLSDFSEDFRIYRITDIDSPDGVDARGMDLVSSGHMSASELQEDHIAFIGVKNIEGYPDAAIELSPSVTVIQGPNQRGKSSWARMLRAAFMAEGGDAIIRHEHSSGEIAIGFSDGRVLEYQRNRKGAAKAEFAMHSPESWKDRLAGVSLKEMRTPDASDQTSTVKPLHHTIGAKVPEWMKKETGICTVDDINVQLWPQFTPVFMLDRSASARASLLSIGRESGYLYAMSETHKEDLRADNTKVRESEKEIAAIRLVSKSMQELPAIIATLDALQADAQDINEKAKEIREIGNILDQIRSLSDQCASLDSQAQALSQLLDVPKIEPTERMERWLSDFARAAADARIEITATLDEPPEAMETSFLQRIIEETEVFKVSQKQYESLPSVLSVPDICETSFIQNILSGLSQAKSAIIENPPEIDEIPNVESTNEIQTILHGLTRASKDLVDQLPTVSDIPEIVATTDIELILDGLNQAKKDAINVPDLEFEPSPGVQETAEIGNILVSLKSTKEILAAQKDELLKIQAEMNRLEQELTQATNALGNECPICHSIMTVDMVLGKGLGVHEHKSVNDPAPISKQNEPCIMTSPDAQVNAASRMTSTPLATSPLTQNVQDVSYSVQTERAMAAAAAADPAPSTPVRLRSFRR